MMENAAAKIARKRANSAVTSTNGKPSSVPANKSPIDTSRHTRSAPSKSGDPSSTTSTTAVAVTTAALPATGPTSDTKATDKTIEDATPDEARLRNDAIRKGTLSIEIESSSDTQPQPASSAPATTEEQPPKLPWQHQRADGNQPSLERKILRKQGFDFPWFQKSKIGDVLFKRLGKVLDDRSFIHLTADTAESFREHVTEGAWWFRLGDVKNTTVEYYQQNWIGKDARGYINSPYHWSAARGFVIVEPVSPSWNEFKEDNADPERRYGQQEHKNLKLIDRLHFTYVVLQ